MSLHNINKIKVTLEYLNKTVNEEIDPYKTIKFIKERAMKIFYQLNSEIRLLYLNKDLSSYENITLAEYFKNKGSIQIKIVDNTKKKSNNNSSAINYNQYNSNNLHNIDLNKDKSYMNLNDDENNGNRIYKTNDEFQQRAETNKLNKNKHKNIDNNKISAINNLCECNNDIINFFCRTCNIFLCKNCRIDFKHQTHKSLHIDVEHPEESVKLYAITLQSDINLNLKAGRIYSNNFQNKKFIDIESRKEIVVRKLNEIERRFEDKMRNLPQVDEKEINNILTNLEEKGNLANSELEDILNLIYKNYFKLHKKLSIEEMNKFFQHIYLKEKEIEFLANSIIAYKINYEIHKKIDEMYKIIETAIDNVLFTDLKEDSNPLDDTNMLTLDVIIMMKNNNTSYKSGDMNMEKKQKNKEENNVVVYNNNVRNNENSILNKSEKTMKHHEENNKKNVTFKRMVIEAVDKNKEEDIEDKPSFVDDKFNNEIGNHIKKMTKKNILNISANNNMRDASNRLMTRKQNTLIIRGDNRYLSIKNSKVNNDEDGDGLEFPDDI